MISDKENNIGFKIVLLIPVINAIATSTTNYFTPATFNPGVIRALIILLFIIYFIFNKYHFNKTNTVILFYGIYIIILSLLSSDVYTSFYGALKMFLAMMMYPIGVYYINDMNKFKNISIAYVLVLLIFLADITLANIYELGSSDYLEGSFYFGVARVNITKTMIILLFTAPILLYITKNSIHRYIYILIYISTFIITILGVKRSVLLSIVICGLVFIYLSPVKSKTIYATLMLLIILTSVSTFYIDTVKDRLHAREDRIYISEESVEEESRLIEAMVVIENMYGEGWRHRIIGSEIFNDTQYYNTTRMLHTDYMIILNGAGILGLLLWFYIYIVIIKEKNNYYNYIKSNKLYRMINAVFWIIIIGQLLISISGTVYSLTFRSLLFLYLGGIIGVMRSYIREYTRVLNSSH